MLSRPIVQIVALSLLLFFTFVVLDAGLTLHLSNIIKPVAAQAAEPSAFVGRNEFQIIKEGQDRTVNLLLALQLDVAEMKGKFTVVYGILSVMGAALFLPMLQVYAARKQKEQSTEE